ncbi:tetratricopeptide repeat protein [Allochromatium palmeri]|uniref:Ancillary SecYEG translocon subunit n=1 Tax=Allochromatium palmeri TaxID=231048 RepID=A0A6N8E8N6_9GAMM|nr:tetratricopeptide repeat protein [Allochromatium palmeri]
MSYETDEEKVEAIKKWWKDNGLSVIAGAAIGLGAIWGWRLWIGHQESTASQASLAFEQLMINAADQQAEAVAKQVKRLEDDFGSTPYSALGELVAAKSLYEAGQAKDAMATFQKAIDTAPDPAIARLAAVRLARLQFAENQLDAAAKTLDQYDVSPAFAGEFAAVRGDIAAARGDLEAARAAYQRAIESGSSLSQLIRLKLDNLPAAG